MVPSRLLHLPTPLRPNRLMTEYCVSASVSPLTVYTYSAMISKEKEKNPRHEPPTPDVSPQKSASKRKKQKKRKENLNTRKV